MFLYMKIAICVQGKCKIYRNCYFVKHYCNLKQQFSILIYFKIEFIYVIEAEFSASLLQSSVSRDPSEIILIYWFIINVLNRCAASYFLWNCDLCFRIF